MYTLTVLNEKNVSMSCPPHTVSGNHPMNVGENDKESDSGNQFHGGGRSDSKRWVP